MPWRNVLGAHLREMTPEQALASLRRIQMRIGIAEQPEVCRLTDLPPYRITPFVISQVCEKLAKVAGLHIHKFDPTEQVD